MESENIGFKSSLLAVFMAILTLAFIGIFIFFMVRFGYSDNWMLLIYALLLCFIIIFGCVSVDWLSRPKVLVRMDENNVYVWRRSGWITVPLEEVVTVQTFQEGWFIRTGQLSVLHSNGKKLKLNGLKEPQKTSALIQQRLYQKRS